MAYNKTNWQNSPSTSTPINATNLNNIENGIKTNDDKLLGNTPMGNVVVDSIRSKNMLNPSASISGAIANNSTNEATDGSTSAITSGWIPCKPNTSYTLSGDYNRIRWQSKAENNTITFVGENLTTITTNSTAKWIRVYFYYNSGGAINPTSIKNIQVEEGSTATSYSPYQELDRPTIQTGSGTINTTYIDTVENNHYEKSDNVVVYSFTMKIKGTWGATTNFVSGLPKAKVYTRFLGINTNTGAVLRLAIGTGGGITNAYSNTTPSAGHTIEGCVVYMTED